MYLHSIKEETFGKSLYFTFLKSCQDVYSINNVSDGYLLVSSHPTVVVDHHLAIRVSVTWVWWVLPAELLQYDTHTDV